MLSSMICVGSVLFSAGSPVSQGQEALTIDVVRNLSDSERTELLVGLFEARLLKTANVQYDSEVSLKNHKYIDRKVGDVFWEGMRYAYRRRNLGDSYRVERDCYAGDSDRFLDFEVFGYESHSGDHRVYGRDSSGRSGARIDTEHDSHIRYDRVNFWFVGPDEPATLSDVYYLFPHLLSTREDWEFEFPTSPDDKTVLLKVPWKPPYLTTAIEAWQHVWLDAEKGFLPVRGEARWQAPWKPTEDAWREERFHVDEAREIDGIWVPTKFTEIVWSSSMPPERRNVANVYTCTIDRIEFGKVTPADMDIEFPAGVEVVDAVRGIRYVVGPEGEETKNAPLYVGNQIAVPRRPSRWPMIITSLFAVATAAASAWYLFRRRKLRPGEPQT